MTENYEGHTISLLHVKTATNSIKKFEIRVIRYHVMSVYHNNLNHFHFEIIAH